MRGVDSFSRSLTYYVGCEDLKLSQNVTRLDNDAQNTSSRFVAPLVAKMDEGRGTLIVELCTKDVVK